MKDQLKQTYEACCNEYRRRLCEQWSLDYSLSWWVPSDRVGEILILNDCEYSMGMSDAIMFVEMGVSYEDYLEWFEEAINGCPINAWSWFARGARPNNQKP